MMRANVRINLESQAEMIAQALDPEVSDDLSRSSLQVSHDQGDLLIAIEADDLVSLRAALNSYLRWTKLAIETNEAVGVIG